MTSCRNFTTVWMKYKARMSSIVQCWFQRAPDFLKVFSCVFVLMTQLRISAGCPNSVLLPPNCMCVRDGEWVTDKQKNLCGFLPVLPTHPVGCKCQWEPRHQQLLILCNAFPKSLQKTPQEQCWWFATRPKSPGFTSRGCYKLTAVTSPQCAGGSCSIGISLRLGAIKICK